MSVYTKGQAQSNAILLMLQIHLYFFFLAVKYGLDGENSKLIYIHGGPLPEDKKFRLVKFVFHWGNATHGGAEHLKNGKRYFKEDNIQLKLYSQHGYFMAVCYCSQKKETLRKVFVSRAPNGLQLQMLA